MCVCVCGGVGICFGICVCESHASGAPLSQDWARGLFDEQSDCYILKRLKDGAVLHLLSGGEEALAATRSLCVCVCVCVCCVCARANTVRDVKRFLAQVLKYFVTV